jgi:hypothetical protein
VSETPTRGLDQRYRVGHRFHRGVELWSGRRRPVPCGTGKPGLHGVTDPRIDINWGRSGLQVSLRPPAIDQLERELIHAQKVYLDRPYYRWTLRLNWPMASEITFGAVGFTQTLRADPVLTDQQSLSLSERSRLARG